MKISDIVEQVASLRPEGWSDLVPLCDAHGINLAIDNLWEDSFRIMVVNSTMDVEENFNGPAFETTLNLVGDPNTTKSLKEFLQQNSVVVIYNTIWGRAFSGKEYIRRFGRGYFQDS
jgi:hypothetical protein